jgi:cytochrome c oxidase assembly protein Cox11
MDTFRFQYAQNPVYRQWCDLTGVDPVLKTHTSIPALPISFFKTHTVTTTAFTPETVFESSGTTKTNTSKHL